ncbi:hypothetical protein, partial [uncultured Prevotella sp.]|uniref:hypothetical protein n=1 Tax=uncultured Prevotella sp. TaxID=159272 RepID=UPI0026078B59
NSATVLQQRSFSKADAKVVSFTIQSKCFYEKCAQKHVVFVLFYRIRGKQAKFTFYIFMRAKETVNGNRGGEDGGKKIQRGLSPEKRRKGER